MKESLPNRASIKQSHRTAIQLYMMQFCSSNQAVAPIFEQFLRLHFVEGRKTYKSPYENAFIRSAVNVRLYHGKGIIGITRKRILREVRTIGCKWLQDPEANESILSKF